MGGKRGTGDGVRRDRSRRLGRAVLAVIATAILVFPLPASGKRPPTGTRPWVFALCTFKDSPRPASGFMRTQLQQFFTEAGAGQGGVFDYWRDVSFGRYGIGGSVVTDWSVARTRRGRELTRDEWRALDTRGAKIDACANGVADQVDLKRYWGVVAVYPEAASKAPAEITADATTIDVERGDGLELDPSLFPNPPFIGTIAPEIAEREDILVTRVEDRGAAGYRLTVERGVGETPARRHPPGARVQAFGDSGSSSSGGDGPYKVRLRGGTFNLAHVLVPHVTSMTFVTHEMGHGLGFSHSSTRSTPTQAYGNCADILSAFSCVYRFVPQSAPGGAMDYPPGPSGPGLTAPQLDHARWIRAEERRVLPPARRGQRDQRTIRLHALGDPRAPQALRRESSVLEARIPAVNRFKGLVGRTRSDYYTLEYRDQAGWDAGFPYDGVVLQLHARDGHSYWADRQTTLVADQDHRGLLAPGDRFYDVDNRIFGGVNSIDPVTRTAQVTVARGGKVQARATFVRPASGTHADTVEVSGRLTMANDPRAPLPNAYVEFVIGRLACHDNTDADGWASCEIPLRHDRGRYTAEMRYPGDFVHERASGTAPFRVFGQRTRLDYTGSTRAQYRGRFTASASLTTTDGLPIGGKPVAFTLLSRGGRPGRLCTAETDPSGHASCDMTAERSPETYRLRVSYAGAGSLEPAEQRIPFRIDKIPTRIDYLGPDIVTNGDSVTLRASLEREGASRRTAAVTRVPLTFVLGRRTERVTGFFPQECEGLTDRAGVASCTIDRVRQRGAEAPVTIRFPGTSTLTAAEGSATVAVRDRAGTGASGAPAPPSAGRR